ncbi:hypothetical protein, partial [Brevifollis gellanilyticus]|uniref:hypothetical protein n=1 Tax=Brevifollis gellanilyticus TaxID=748831 RepID=UPI001C3F9FC7
SDPAFLKTAEEWFSVRPDILVLIRYSHAGGNRSFELFSSFQEFTQKLRELTPLTCVIVFRQVQLPFRGVVEDDLIAKCLQGIPEGAAYLVTETVRRVYGKASWFHYSDGESHAELRESLEDCRGAPVAAGLYPPWLHDSEDVISAVVPGADGVVRSGVY